MCGFFGVVSNLDIDKSLIKKSDEFLICRGPDENIWTEVKHNNIKSILNSFHRLSILDLSSMASQPMRSEQFNTEILFNGEIYNHLTLRKNLENSGYNFKSTHSDTETLLAGLSVYGLDFVEQIEGQFSIVFLDFRKNELSLIRDRLGQKPLFYHIDDDKVLYSSNIKSILNYKKDFNPDFDQISIFLELGVIPSPNTLDKTIKKVEPGEIIKISMDNFSITSKYQYWDLTNYMDNKKFNNSIFFELLKNSVSKRLLADVPIAFLLSGGIDSTSIIKLAIQSEESSINTFSVHNKDAKYDESYWSNKVVDKYKTNQETILIDGKNLSIDVFEVINSFDEPYADPSIIPSYMIYKEISKKYKVAISGDGGDELLGGYEKINLSMKKSWLPNIIYKFIYKLIPSRFGSSGSIAKFSNSVETSFTSLTIDRKLLKLLNFKSKFNFEKKYLNNNYSSLKKLLYADYKFYFSELMLLKVDRTSMANSIEVRSPFLDHKLVEYIFSTDLDFIDLNNSKSILKEFLQNDFEKTFIDRKKMGFVFDLENWIYQNKNDILSKIAQNNLFQIEKVKVLFKVKKRINAIRIFKILIICEFLKSYDSFNIK